ncbi:MAG: redoxin domain-containing protein [Dehalococcoidia bacterium]|jgi:peroxiredoxin
MEDIKNVFEKIKKAEAILDELDRKRGENADENNALAKLDKEYLNSIASARHTLASIKEKLSKELAVRILELDKCQEDLATLDARLKVGEITEEEHQTKGKHLIEKIKILEQKVTDIQSLIAAKFAENIAPVIQSGKALVVAGPLIDITPAPQKAVELKKAEEDRATEKVSPAEEKATELEKIEEKAPEKEEIRATEPGQNVPEIMKNEEKKEAEKASKPVGGDTKKTKSSKGRKPSLHLHPLKADRIPGVPMSVLGMMKKNRTLTTILAAIALGFLAWGVIALVIPRPGYNVGNIAPDFVMQLSDNNTSALSSFRGKDVIVVFWDRDFWDGQFFYVNGVQHKLYTPDSLNELYAKYQGSDLAIIAIASGTNNNEVDTMIQDYGIKFPVIVDSFGKLRASYNVSYEPTFFFLDKSGMIRSRVEGPIMNTSDFEQILYSVSKNSEIKQAKPPVTDVLIQSITEKSAVVNWSTDSPTTTQLDIDGKNILSVITAAPQTIHSLTMRDLSPGASYHVRILYNINNINVSEHSFTALADTIVSKPYLVTTSNNDTSAPEISNVSTGFVTDSSITVTWKTDEPATGLVDYGKDTNYSDTETQIEPLSIWHTVKINGLQANTLYYLQLESKDASGKQSVLAIEAIQTQSTIEVASTVGARAPDFSLYSIDGTRYTLSQFLGHPVLLNFWLEGCPACESEMPLIQAAYDKYGRDQLTVLAVNVHGDPDKVQYYLAQGKFTFPVLMDSEGNVDDIYKAPYFPTTYLIDSKGIIQQIIGERFQSLGEIDDALKKLE